MGLLIVLLLILAALTGVFWTVLKVVVVAVIATVLTVLVLGFIIATYVKRRFRRFMAEGERQRGTIDARGRREPNEPLPPGL
jgi:Flp pilus assembly protein TadB